MIPTLTTLLIQNIYNDFFDKKTENVYIYYILSFSCFIIKNYLEQITRAACTPDAEA